LGCRNSFDLIKKQDLFITEGNVIAHQNNDILTHFGLHLFCEGFITKQIKMKKYAPESAIQVAFELMSKLRTFYHKSLETRKSNSVDGVEYRL
jgi:hypothetical protein